MKAIVSSLIVLALTTTLTMAAGTGDHSHDDDASMAGKPGKESEVTKTIAVKMLETDDGDMLFEPTGFKFEKGQTIKFEIVNTGEEDHEFVIDDHESNQKHKKAMEKFPEMEHDDPNSVRLEPGETGKIIWKFSNSGTFEIACLIPGHYELGMKSDVTVEHSH